MTNEDRPTQGSDVPQGWVCVYSLLRDTKFIALVQKASLEA